MGSNDQAAPSSTLLQSNMSSVRAQKRRKGKSVAAEREEEGEKYRGSQEKAPLPGSQFKALCWRGADSARRALFPEKTWTRTPHDCTADLRNDSARVGSKACGTESGPEDGETGGRLDGSGYSRRLHEALVPVAHKLSSTQMRLSRACRPGRRRRMNFETAASLPSVLRQRHQRREACAVTNNIPLKNNRNVNRVSFYNIFVSYKGGRRKSPNGLLVAVDLAGKLQNRRFFLHKQHVCR